MKRIILICISILSLSSCIINTSHESHFDKMLQGMWQINNEKRILYVEKDSFKIERLFNIIECYGHFVNNSIPDDPPRWIWEDAPDYDLSIHWFSGNHEGDMIYLNHTHDETNLGREIMIVRDLPFSENIVDTLYRIQNLNN